MATNNNPFEKYLEASQRQRSNYNDLSQGIEKLRSEYETQTPDVVFKNKTINNYAQDLGIAALKGAVLVPQVAVGLADIAGYGAEKAAQGYGELAALTGLVDRPQEVNYTGHLGKALAELGLDFKTTQEVLDRNYSDPTLRQKQELQALGEMNLDNGLFSQNNLDVLAAKAGYVLDNPSLAVNEIITSLPLIGAGAVIGNAVKGAAAVNLAARSGGAGTPEAIAAANQIINSNVRNRIGYGALGEGAVSAGLLQETSRQHSDTGLTTPEQTLLSTAAGLGVGALGYLGGRAAIRAGVADVDTALINSDPLRAAYLKNNPVSRLVGGAVREGLEEVPQENLENFAENINNTRGNGNILYGAADSTVLGAAAGALTGGAVNLPTEAGNAFKDIATGLNKAKETIKDKVTLKSYEELSNPDNQNYDPVKAFNLQAKNLLSDDEALRTQAKVSVDELTTGLETNIDTVLQRKTQLDKEINDIDPLDYSDEAKVKNLALYEESKSIDKLLPSLLTQYEQLAIAKDDLEKNKEKINGTTYTEEQAKQDIAVLNQEPVQQSVIWNYEGNNIPVIIVSSAKVNEAGEEVIDISYDFDGIPLEVTVPTKELNLPDTTAQEQAIANVTKHFSKFSPEELEVISKSPYLSEQQRNSLRQLSAVKQRIASSSDIGKVRDHILNGLKGATPRDSHRGMNTYTELVNTGIRNNDERLVNIALTELGDFAQHHTDKAKVINEAFAQVKQGETIRVARTKDGVWGMIKNPTTAKQNGEYDIHVNSNKTSANRPVGLIDSINQEVSIITDHYNALRGIAESFGGVSTPNAIEPVVAQDSTDKNVPSADVNTGNIDTKEYTNHSGGAYGADTLWDTVGRSLGFNNHNHYRDSNNTTLSAKLKQAGVKAVELSKKQMETARNEVQKLLNRTYPDTVQGNLQVRNYYQVANSDGVYAIAALNGNNAVKGGTNTAVQLGIKLGKPVYVWDINTEQWYKFDTNSKTFKATKTPTLTKNFAGVGTRDIENYNVLKNGKWVEREAYVGDEKAQKAQQAVKDVYEKTLAQNTSPVQTAETTPNNLEPIGLEASEIYSKLGTKTISGNVVQQSWGKLKTATKAVYDKAVISTRIPNTDEHFGNPFSSDSKVLASNPTLIKTNSTKESVEKYIDWVLNSKDARAKWVREQLKSGNLKGKQILYYTELNEPSHATALDYLINKYDWNTESTSTPNQEVDTPTAKIGETTTKVKGKFTATKTVISDNTVLSVHTNNDTGEVTKSEYVTTYPDIYSDEFGDKYTIVIYRDSANPSVITDVKSFDPKDKKNSTGSYGKQGNQTDEKFITTFTEAGDVTLEYTNKFEKSLPVVNTTTQQDTKATQVKPNDLLAILSKYDEVLPYAKGEKSQNVFITTRGLISEAGKKVEKLIMSLGTEIANYFGLQYEDVRVNNNLGSLDAIRQYKLNGKAIGDAAFVAYKYLNTPQLFEELGKSTQATDMFNRTTQAEQRVENKQDIPVVNKDSLANPVTELLKANLEPTEFLVKAKELGIVGAALEVAKGIYNRTKAKVSITKAVKENKAILQQIEDTKQDLRLYNFGLRGIKINITTDEGVFEDAYVSELSRTKNGEIDYKFQVESDYTGFKPNPVLKAELEQQLVDLPKQLKPLGKPNKYFKDYFDIETKAEPEVNSTTNPTVESNDITEVVADSDVTIKIVGNITEVFNSKSGLTHKVPTVLLNKMLSVKHYLEQVSSVESGILKPKEKEYISKLLSVFTQLRPNVLVTFLTDFSKIDKKIAEALPTSVGKSVDGNKIYIDVTNKTPVDMLELLTHEYHHAVTIETLDKTPLNTSYHIELAKVHESIIKYLEDNPTLSAKARKRLSYALTAPAELLTVGTTEPIAIASLRKIDMGNGKTAYTVIMEQSIAIMKEQYSKTFTKEIEDSLNDLLSRTDRNFTTDEASSTKDSSIPSSEAASTTSDNTRTSDESIELQPDSNTESAATEVVNTAGLSVLQGLSKEVIAEERTKPLSTINLVKAYFSQKLNKDETKGTNPLVAVNNFMQSLPKTFNEVRAYVSNYLEPSYKITDEQLKQLEQFRKFELGFSTIASNLFSNRYINNKYAPDAPTQNVILYFRDAKGNLDTNMLTAMAASAFQYLIVNGTKVGNKEEDVRKLLRLDAKAPLPYEVSSALQYVGADVKTVVRELGKSIYKSLGLSVDKQGDVDLQQRVELALGQLALDTLVESGYLKENLLDSTAITEISDAMIAAGYSTANTLSKVNKLTFVSSNVVFNDKGSLVINDEGKVTFEALKPVNVGKKEEVVLPTVEAIKEANEGTVSFLQDLFSTDNGYRMPELLEPTKFVQDSIRGTDAKVSEYQKELLTEAHKHASTMRKNTISVLNKLKGIGGNSKYLRQLINAWYDKESLEKVHILRRDSVIVAAEDIWNALENGLQWANIIAKPDGYAEFYSPQDVAQNSRMHTTATFFNEQANQVHRAMANKKEHNITLNIKSDSTEDLNNILRFFQAVGEGLEDLPLGSSINSQVPGYKFFTTDKVRGDHYVSSLLAYLFSEKTKPAIDAMITLIENDTIDTKQQEAISKFVDKGGMGIQSLQSLIAIAEYFKAIKEGKTNIEINTPFSSDGVNDGVASANILMGTATPELLQQVGMFLRQETGVQTESMQDNYMKGIEDYYVSFGNKIREALANLANEKIDKEWAKATLALFTKLQLSKDDMKAIRKIAKTWSVPFNYSAGKAALQRALARDFLENIYDQFESIGGEALDNRKAYAEAKGKKDNDSMAALEIAYAGLKRDVQTLETNIQNALGYGFLAPSSTKVRQVRGSLYRSLSDIKLPVSRPENLLSFTFNTGSVEIIEVITTSNLDKNGEETSSTKNSFVHTGRDAERIIEKYLMSASTAMFGKAAWEATEEFAGKFIASRDLFTEIQNSTFSLYNQLRNALIDAKIESKKDKTFGGYFTLTIAEMEEIDNKLLEFAPILKTVFSIKATSETDALASGLRLYDSTYTTSLLSKRPDLRQVITRYTKRDGTPATTTTNLGREVLEKGGVKNGATAIQSIDAFVSATVQAIFGILNAHDAAFFGLDKFVAGTLLQNETYLEAMTKYHFGLEHAESLLRSYKGLESVVQSLGLKKEYADTLSQLFEQVLLGEEVKDKTENVLLDVTGTAILSGGIVGALNDMLLLEEKETFNSNGRDIEEVLEVLVKTLIAKDISKLNQLKNLHSVHHFSGEGGQVLVTEEHIKEMDKQIKLLKAKEKELLALITKEADGIAIDNKSITEYLTENKGKDIKYTVFKPYLELNSKPEHKAVLGLIEKLIPTGLTIRYQEQDIATEGYGNYDEKTNTITITAIPDSKVSIALVIHELLHSALAQRINTLEEAERTGNTKGLEKAIAALNSVKALRETIIGKDGLAYLELKKVIEGKAKGKSFKDYKIELETLRTSLNAKFDKENKDYANIVAQLKEVQANINEVNRFFGLVDKLKQEQKEAVIAQPTYTVATGAIDEAGNAVERVVTRLSIINKFENIHEFISYGLTDRRVQAVLAAIETPVNSEFKESTTKRLSNFVRDFVLKVANLLGLKGQNATLLVPFYIEVGKLIDEITQASVPPTPSNRTHQSTTDYNDSVNEMDSLTVMQGLPHSNSEFSQHLNNIITDSIGQLYKADDTARQRINEIQNLQASEARNAGFSLSAKEAIVQQALQLAVETYMLTNAGNLNISQLFKVFKEAKAKMNEESFHNGDWNTATRLERSIAKKKYDFIFDTTKKGFEARFISMALASEEVHNLLGFNTISPKPSKEKTWFDTANSWLKYAISWLANKYVKLNPSNPVHKQISQLVDNLVKLDIRSRQETVAIWEHAWNLIGKVTTPLNVLAKASKDKLAANNFLLNSKYLPLRAVGAIAALDAKAISESIPKAITSMRNELRPNERLGEAMNAMLEASAATGMRKVMDVLIRQGNQNAHERQNISDGTKKSILSWFKEPNKLTKRQHLATTNVILRADLQALTGKFELEEVMDLIGDEVTLNNEIKVLEQSIAKEANGNGMLVASKLLAKYMVTIIGGNGLVKNARAISVGLGTHYQQADVTNVDEALVENIDLLVSMYALKYTYQGDKDIVTSLYKKEPEALLGILNLHYGLVEQAKTLFKDNPLNFNKGWLPDIANPYKGIKYAESKEEVETLQSLGWQLITPTGLKKDPLDITETKYMMIHNDMAYQRIVSGAVDLGNPSRKGNEVASKWNGLLTPIVKGRNASSQQLSKIPYDKFDPFKQEGGLIAAYDTEGYVIGYSYEMEGSTRNSLLDRNNNFADLLGAYAGANFYKPVKEYQSKKVADVLFQDYKDNFKKNPNAYLKLSKDSKDPRVAEMWRMLPHDFKQRAIELYGKGEPIVIRNEAFLLAFGFKKYTVAEVFNKLAKDRNAAEKAFVIFANTLLGNPVANMFLKGTVADKAVKVEKAIQDIMRVVKDFIVIRSINVLWNNVLSNLFTLMAHGINPITAIKNWSFAVANVRAYQTQNAELIQLRNDLLAGKDVKQTEQRIGVLEAQLKRNPITKYVEAGLLSSIVEDVTIQDADYTYTSQFKQKVDNATGWIPNAVKTAGNWLILSPSTQGYQFLATTTQLSDFVAKYTLAEHLQKGGMKFDEAVLEASQTFINYDVPTSRGMQYANDIGLFMFTKFFLRIQAVLYKLLDKRMASVIGQQIAVDQFTNFQGVLDPLAVFHIGNSPFEASVFNAHSALFDVGVF
ncbi:hypothetical protein [uncultured Flavobacterium sp.]|uniref:hypothetical protein n=1 Tax=uncultured Flavobacterium sp. TaxID=165435 RepID=UPI0025970880|nr:hypothetical protein [uncultured Flavobacterium sp.]